MMFSGALRTDMGTLGSEREVPSLCEVSLCGIIWARSAIEIDLVRVGSCGNRLCGHNRQVPADSAKSMRSWSSESFGLPLVHAKRTSEAVGSGVVPATVC